MHNPNVNPGKSPSPLRHRRGGAFRRAFRKLVVRATEAGSLREARRRTVRHNDFSRAFAVSEPLHILGDGLLDGGISMLERLTVALLIRFQKPRRIVEIGTYCGVTTRLVLDNAPGDAEIWTMDLPEAVRSSDELENSSDERLIRGRDLGAFYRGSPEASRVHQVLGNSQDVETWKEIPPAVDFAFIDGSHTYEAVKKDTFHLLDRLSEEAIVVWHDYTRSVKPERGVGKFLREQLSEWDSLFFLEGTTLGLRCPRRMLHEQAAKVRDFYVAGDYDSRRPQGAFPWLKL